MSSRSGQRNTLTSPPRLSATTLAIVLSMVLFGAACSGGSRAEKLHDQATLLFKHGSYYKAIEKLEQALQIQPARIDSQCLLADAYLRTGKPELAVQHARAAVQQDPDSDAAHLVLGQAYLTQALSKARTDEDGRPVLSTEDLKDAADIADQLLKRDPDSAEGLLLQARIEALSGRTESAAQLYAKVLDSRPDDPVGRLGLLETLMEREQYQEAEQQARAMVDSDASDRRALAYLARATSSQGRHREAYELLLPQIGAENKDPELSLYLTAGELLLDYLDALRIPEKEGASVPPMGPAPGREQDWEWAAARLAELGTAMKGIYPNRPESYFFRGISYQLQNEKNLAVEQMGQAVDMAPGSKRYRMALSATLMLAGEYDAVLREMRTLLKSFPNDNDARIRMSQALIARSSFDEAREILTSLQDGLPDDPRVKALVAQVILATGDTQDVEDALTMAAGPDGAAELGQEQRDYLLGETALREALNLQAQGRLEDAARRLVAAEAYFTSSVALQPDHAMSHLRLAELCERRGDLLQALDHARAAAHGDASLRPFEARLFMQLGHYEAADRIFQDLQDENEDPIAWQLARAEVADRRGDVTAALKQCDSLIESHPDDPRAYLQKSTILVRESRPDEAAILLAGAAQRFPDNPGLRLALARVAVRQDELDRAESLLTELIELADQQVAAQKAQGRSDQELLQARQAIAPVRTERTIVELLQGKIDPAARSLAAADALTTSGDAIQLAAIIELYQGHPEQAARRLADVPAVGGSASQATPIIAALAWAAAGKADLAAESLGDQRLLTPDATELFRRMLRSRSTGELSAAAAPLSLAFHLDQLPFFQGLGMGMTEKALSILPEEPFILSRQAEMQVSAAQYQNALELYERIWRALPEFTPALTAQADVLGLMARAASAAGNPDEARSLMRRSRDMLEKHLEAHPDDAVALEKLALLLQVEGDIPGSNAAYARVIELDPENSTACNNLAWNLAQLGQLEEAARMAEKALAAEPDNGGILDTAGLIELRRGNADRAADLLAQASRRLPNNTEIRFHLAQALARQKENDKAAHLLETILAASRDDALTSGARQLLQEVAPGSAALQDN